MATSNILLLRGVYPNEAIENLESMFITKLEQNSKLVLKETKYEQLPELYETNSTWPKVTKLHCWYDGFPFNSIPIFIPKNISGNNTMTVYGCFCSFPCAISHINNEMDIDIDKKLELKKKMCILHKQMTGRNAYFILPSSSKSEIKEYGGSLNVDTWRENNKEKINIVLPC